MNALRAGCSRLGCLAAFGAVACGSGSDIEKTQPNDPAVEQVMLKGHAVFGHEVRSIRPCGDSEAVWAIDSTQLLWDLHAELAPGMEPYEEVFVVVRGSLGDAPPDGFGAEYPGSFVINQVLYAGGEGFGCNLDLSGFQYRLSGNEPFWTLSFTDTTAKLSRMGSQDQIWSGLQSERSETSVSYMGESNASGLLEVHVSQEPCRDSMSGAFYGYSASVLVASEDLEGCALRGAG